MCSQDEKPDRESDTTRDQIGKFWGAALERLKLRAESSVSQSQIRVKMTPMRVVWNRTGQNDD